MKQVLNLMSRVHFGIWHCALNTSVISRRTHDKSIVVSCGIELEFNLLDKFYSYDSGRMRDQGCRYHPESQLFSFKQSTSIGFPLRAKYLFVSTFLSCLSSFDIHATNRTPRLKSGLLVSYMLHISINLIFTL